MARKYLIGINLNRNELQNAVIQPLASAPSSPQAGLVYFDTTLDKFGVYDGTQWVYMGDFDGSNYVALTGNQTINGIKTFGSFPITPSSAPTTDYQVANKKYVDDAITAGGGYTDEDAQDAVGNILVDSPTLSFEYDDVTPDISADVLDSPLLQGQNSAYHRNRANHTGTQTASTISDFQSTVSANTDVAANTAARHTHANKTILDNTTASFTTADETKLDYLTVTAATNLDDIRTRVNDLDAAVVLKGSWDASAGTFPGGGTAQAGFSYIISVAGTVNGVQFSVGDRIVAITDNASTSTYAANWLKLDYTDAVLSVNGQTGAVTLTKSDVGLGNVDNTSDANKPVSTAQQTALDLKINLTQKAAANGVATLDASTKIPIAQVPTGTTGTTVALGNHTHTAATTAAAGFTTLATQAEANAKTVTTKAVTPAALADFARKYTALIGGSTSIAVTHGLGSQWVTAQAFDATTNELIECDIVLTSATQVTFGFSVAPAASAIRVVITG